MSVVLEFRAQHESLCAIMRHLLDVAHPERGFRAAAPGLLRDLDHAIAALIKGRADAGGAEITPDAEPLDRLRADWRGFVARWNTTQIAIDWPGFAAAAQAIVPRMLMRIEQEGACLTKEAETSGHRADDAG